MPIYIYFPPNQKVKIRIQYNNIIQRSKLREGLTEDFESSDTISFYPFNLADEAYANFTIHIFTSENIESVLKFDCFDIKLPNYNSHMKLLIERNNPTIEKKIIVEYNNGNDESSKQFFAFNSRNWNKNTCAKFLKHEKCGEFFIELAREKFLIIKQKSRPSLDLEEH